MINSKLLNQLINWKTLAGIFVLIVLLSELIGGGVYFYHSGIIHLISVIYLLLIVLAVVNMPNLKNSRFRMVFTGFILAAVILSFTHVIEYISSLFIETENFEMAMDLTVIGISIIAMILILVSIESAMHSIFINLKKFLFAQIMIVIIMGLGLTSIYFFPALLNSIQKIALWLVLNGMVIGGILSIESYRMANKFSILKDFLKNISDGVILLTFSIIFECLEIIKIPQLQPARGSLMSHYIFFLAISVVLLGFMKIYNLQGIYETPDSESELREGLK